MKKNLLKIIPLLMMIFSFCCSVYAQDNSISVVIDGRQVQFDVEPQLIDGRTMLPVRAIFNELGATVDWDKKLQTVSVIQDTSSYTMLYADEKLLIG